LIYGQIYEKKPSLSYRAGKYLSLRIMNRNFQKVKQDTEGLSLRISRTFIEIPMVWLKQEKDITGFKYMDPGI